MARHVVTHNGPFHADDVLAWALLSAFVDPDFVPIRTRDEAVIAKGHIVFDVGGEYDPSRARFDHHQLKYKGDFSSAGMVLDWLISEEKLDKGAGLFLKTRLVDYVDAVDNGRQMPDSSVPCFASIVEAFGSGCDSMDDFDQAFLRAGDFARIYVQGLVNGFWEVEACRKRVEDEMSRAQQSGSRIMVFDSYCKWKKPYFENQGKSHPTDYVLFPSNDGSWRLVAIPPKLDDFGQKRPLPAEWAGLMGEELSSVMGIKDAVFCHRNRFIAVFKTRAAVDLAIETFSLDRH